MNEKLLNSVEEKSPSRRVGEELINLYGINSFAEFMRKVFSIIDLLPIDFKPGVRVAALIRLAQSATAKEDIDFIIEEGRKALFLRELLPHEVTELKSLYRELLIYRPHATFFPVNPENRAHRALVKNIRSALGRLKSQQDETPLLEKKPQEAL